jgi:arabinogalactan oligomer/maltooligosaccharide transport system substrate-binding protein
MWAYPLTADNGFYMFYDKSLISEEDAESMEKLIEICNANDRTFRYPLSNGWYNAGFFFATGCHSEWATDANGKFTSIDDTYNSEAGLIAMKGMQKLAQAKCFNADNEKVLTDAAVIITGTWAVNSVKEVFGDNYAATDLPSFTVDGKSYHIGSFTGNKLMGVKPQTDAKRTVVLSLLAEFLTNDECQLERFAAYGWGPSNLKAQQSEAVQSDPALAAFAKQSAYGKPQGNISGAWWDVAALLGDKAKAATSDADLQKALDEYDASIDAALNKSDDEKMIWSVIGEVNGTMWNTDFKMTQESDGVWISDVLALTEGTGFKLRRGGEWAPQVGAANGDTGETSTGYYLKIDGGEKDPSNITCPVTGNYRVKLEWDGASHTCNVTFVPAE